MYNEVLQITAVLTPYSVVISLLFVYPALLPYTHTIHPLLLTVFCFLLPVCMYVWLCVVYAKYRNGVHHRTVDGAVCPHINKPILLSLSLWRRALHLLANKWTLTWSVLSPAKGWNKFTGISSESLFSFVDSLYYVRNIAVLNRISTQLYGIQIFIHIILYVEYVFYKGKIKKNSLFHLARCFLLKYSRIFAFDNAKQRRENILCI